MIGSSLARRVGLVGMVALLVSVLPLAMAQAQPDPTPDQDSYVDLDADTNVGYSVRWSQFTFESADEVLIGREDLFPDNLASGSLQGQGDGRPLLLTPSDALAQEVIDEIARLGATTVHILGGTEAISEDVEADLEGLVDNVERHFGETRIETAIAISELVPSDTVIVARAFANDDPTQAFADSLAAGAWAADAGFPILLTQTEVLTENTATALADGGYTNAFVVGGEAAIDSTTFDAIDEIVDNVERVGGANRFETAVLIANERGFDSADDAEVTVLTDGQGGAAWADGFSAAAFAALHDAPLVLSNSASEDLPPETVAFLSGNGAASFAQDAVANELDPDVGLVCGPSVPDGVDDDDDPTTPPDNDDDDPTTPDDNDQCAQAAALRGLTNRVEVGEPSTFEVTFDPADSVQAGDDLSVTISGLSDGDEVVISGCGVDETFTVDEADIDEDGNTSFDVTVPGSQAAGDCELSITVNGDEIGPFDVTVTVPPTVTARPELVSARIVGVVTAAQETPGNPAGVRVLYDFDEPIQNAPNVAFFWIYESDGTPTTGSTGTASTICGGANAPAGCAGGDSSQVLVTFQSAAYDTQGEVDNLTLATVSEGAVTDFQGLTNALGDAPIGTAATTPGGTAGTTDAPDLLTVSGFRQGAGPNDTAVDFTFDEAAFIGDTPTFGLVPTNGAATIACVAPALGSGTAGGGTIAGGNGTTTITVICPSTGANNPIDPTTIARGSVGPESVSDASQTAGAPVEGNGNPLQIAEVSAGGNTVDPDLVSATFQPNVTTGNPAVARDSVIYTFDQAPGAVTPADAPDFFVYDSAGNEIAGIAPAAEDNPVVNGNQVLVYFPDGSLASAVGASVRDGAVAGVAPGAGPNEEDEVGVQNEFSTSRTPGETALPQMIDARVEQQQTPFPNGPFQVVMTYDEQVTVVNQSGYVLYQADGTRYFSNACTVGNTASTNNVVTCTGFDSDQAPGAQPPATTSGQIGSAVLVGSQWNTVNDTGGFPNPEESEILTGSTGTPQN